MSYKLISVKADALHIAVFFINYQVTFYAV